MKTKHNFYINSVLFNFTLDSDQCDDFEEQEISLEVDATEILETLNLYKKNNVNQIFSEHGYEGIFYAQLTSISFGTKDSNINLDISIDLDNGVTGSVTYNPKHVDRISSKKLQAIQEILVNDLTENRLNTILRQTNPDGEW